ncbi:MAG: DUF6933 domain-containing protein [Acidimicrobiales bacterium]
MIVRCTRKLLDVIRPEDLADRDHDDADWYANLLAFDRRKCLLLTHAGSLFTIFEPDLPAAELRSTHDLVIGLVERELLAEGLRPGTLGDQPGEPLRYARTADRSVLGCMNDMAFLCENAVAGAGALHELDASSLNRRLHRNINSARGYARPIDLVRGGYRRRRNHPTTCSPGCPGARNAPERSEWKG